MNSRDVARGLAWFGIGLGLAELLAPRAVARAAGLRGHERLLQAFGMREIASGALILAAEDPEAWLWTRVAGDALDGLSLSKGMMGDNPDRERALLATLAVAPVVVLDAMYARRSLRHETAEYIPAPPRTPAPRSPTPVQFSEDVETIPPDEAQTIDAILASMHRLHERTREKFGEAVRVSHAKAHGLAIGELTVRDDLPEPLAQGLFTPGARYAVIARLSNVPGEIDSDAVATQRGLALKLLGVEGEKLPGHIDATQDFVLDTGNRFAAGTAAQFLMNHRMLEHAPQIPDALKAAVSTASRAGNKALHHLGADSPTLDFFGHSRVHPMAEAYFTQAPIRYGDYLAKLAVVPVAPVQRGLAATEVDRDDPNALRTATVGYLREHDSDWGHSLLEAHLDCLPPSRSEGRSADRPFVWGGTCDVRGPPFHWFRLSGDEGRLAERSPGARPVGPAQWVAPLAGEGRLRLARPARAPALPIPTMPASVSDVKRRAPSTGHGSRPWRDAPDGTPASRRRSSTPWRAASRSSSSRRRSRA